VGDHTIGDDIEVVPASADLHRALEALPRRQREVVVLRYFGDLSEKEIASELGLAPGRRATPAGASPPCAHGSAT
jgi:RNA polymerase sigma factor (sigma-70 family)